MKLNLLAFAIPLFIVCMLLEYIVAKRRNISYLNLHDTVANLSIGIAERLIDVFTIGLFYFLYDFLQKHFGIYKIRPGVLMWLLLLICTDFVWYWYHRLAHEISIFWSVHVVHHQSEDFNYTVSARITVFQSLVRTGFWSILPVIGFPAGMITSMLLIHGLYPFFIHTRVVGKLGILEYILVTPSHHRVHHACNEKYLDKNYGDVFIIWDKLFGTFQKEDETEPIIYGLTKQIKSYSFLWQHFHFLIELVYTAKQKSKWIDKLKVFIARPHKVPASSREIAEKKFHIQKRNTQMGKPLNRYVIWQMAVTLISLFVFILFEKNIPVIQQLMVSCLIIITLINCGAIMEQKRWVVYLEISRLFIAGISLVILAPVVWLIISLIITGYLIYYYYSLLQSQYFRYVYTTEFN
ncbi:MAG: sterol desaturase family protein [Bacteroidetes bacterium]|nr:sterol desaturase family protein [Bacteroidota bacterium]